MFGRTSTRPSAGVRLPCWASCGKSSWLPSMNHSCAFTRARTALTASEVTPALGCAGQMPKSPRWRTHARPLVPQQLRNALDHADRPVAVTVPVPGQRGHGAGQAPRAVRPKRHTRHIAVGLRSASRWRPVPPRRRPGGRSPRLRAGRIGRLAIRGPVLGRIGLLARVAGQAVDEDVQEELEALAGIGHRVLVGQLDQVREPGHRERGQVVTRQVRRVLPVGLLGTPGRRRVPPRRSHRE